MVNRVQTYNPKCVVVFYLPCLTTLHITWESWQPRVYVYCNGYTHISSIFCINIYHAQCYFAIILQNIFLLLTVLFSENRHSTVSCNSFSHKLNVNHSQIWWDCNGTWLAIPFLCRKLHCTYLMFRPNVSMYLFTAIIHNRCESMLLSAPIRESARKNIRVQHHLQAKLFGVH